MSDRKTAVLLIGGISLLAAIPLALHTSWHHAGFFILVTILGELVAVPLHIGLELSAGLALDWTVYLVAGPFVSLWNAFFSRLLAGFIKNHRDGQSYLISLDPGRAASRTIALWAAIEAYQFLRSAYPSRGGWAEAGYVLGATVLYTIVRVAIRSSLQAVRWRLNVLRLFILNISGPLAYDLLLALAGIGAANVYSRVSLGGIGVLVFAMFLALVVYATRLYVDIREVHWSTLKALVQAIEAKEPYNLGHAERVADMSVAVARKMYLPEIEIERIYYAALLHDIGAIGLDDTILSKPGPLTAEEYAEVKEHPTIGADIIDAVPFMLGAGRYVRHHHEWYDGSGYPAQLAGLEIPLGARIIAVAEAYDAMVSRRVYRQDMFTWEDAVARLRDGAWTQFDPTVVLVFAEVAAEKARVGERVFERRYSLDTIR